MSKVKIQYCVHETPPLGRILNHLNSIHLSTRCCKLHANIILQNTQKFSELFSYSHENDIENMEVT